MYKQTTHHNIIEFTTEECLHIFKSITTIYNFIYKRYYYHRQIIISLVVYAVIDAPQSGLKGLSQTLNKTIKMRYNAQV
jgi:hypothetical protein